MSQKQTELISRHINTCSKNSLRENKDSYVLDWGKLKNKYILGMTGRSKRGEVWGECGQDTFLTCMDLRRHKQEFLNKKRKRVNEYIRNL